MEPPRRSSGAIMSLRRLIWTVRHSEGTYQDEDIPQSTYQDLVAHRKAAAEALERLGQQTGRMEVFSARPEEPLTARIAEIDECDLFVGIYAHRYGFVPKGATTSITETELDHAVRSNKPIFCFVVHDDHPWPPKMIEEGTGIERLKGLKGENRFRPGSRRVYDA